jgi:5'-nucleotidase
VTTTEGKSVTTEPTSTGSVPGSDAEADSDAGLRILLTNDDGWNAGGLPSLREALLDAGHDVVVFAPADDQSGNSGRMTFGEPLTVTQEQESVFSVAGSPADSTEVGMSLAFPGGTPDLVISGPNPGANIGDASIHSGTIGAAVTAANDGVPAIAVSANGDPEGGEPDYTITNNFVLELVSALLADAGDAPLLPDGVALNVNVPFVPAGEMPTGIAITTTDSGFLDLDYDDVEPPGPGESIDATAQFALTPAADPDSDATAIEHRAIAVTIIEGNYDAAAADPNRTDIDALAATITNLT